MKRTGHPSRNNTWLSCAVKKEAGLTLVELMVSITLGLLVVMVATALLLSSKSGYTTQDDATRLQETGRYALESITRAVRQTAYENWDREQAPIVLAAGMSANLAGLDARRLNEEPSGIESPVTPSINGSDVLAVRFFGTGSGDGDGTILNCAGFSVAAPGQDAAEEGRGWSIFYVAESNGEPELRCKYQGKNQGKNMGKSSWKSDAIVRGVESFQVLYGVDTDADSLPNRFLTATEINALDDALTLEGADAAAKKIDKNRKTNWKKVVVVKIALLVRGSQNIRTDALVAQHDLFGKDYGDANSSTDSGTRIKEDALPLAVRNRLRKVFTATIQLRNQSAGSQT